METSTITVIQARPKPDLVSYKDAAAYLACTVATVQRYVRKGKLTGYRIGVKMRRVDLDEVAALIRVAA